MAEETAHLTMAGRTKGGREKRREKGRNEGRGNVEKSE
jgi:hypothetical protein